MNVMLEISNKLIMALALHASLYGANLPKYKRMAFFTGFHLEI